VKARLTLIFAVLIVMVGATMWIVRDRTAGTPVPVMAVASNRTVPAAPAADRSNTPATVAPLAAPAPERKPAPTVHVAPSGELSYVARDGDTVSQLAIALLGTDSRQNRELIINENASLKRDPDKVLEGQRYTFTQRSAQSGDDTQSKQTRDPAPAASVAAKTSADDKEDSKASVVATGPELRYTAQPGDTVGGLASELLGGDTQANREGIVAGNASLQENPDHMVAGKSYTIVARNGLASDPTAPQAKAPTTQPDADEAAKLGVGRRLRYTAQPGDTLSKMAVVLLGSDNEVNRELIVRSNNSLKEDPDHLVAGQTYWIVAPTEEAGR